ncbi:hypothetical protein CEXT_684021 [Caerostris extrusa]|uniref:Uncharacterized protein n=1 Tax=Caerostris extrusa TaxID=172846 RepID=A0AAV4VLD8_CAEEX|nr:hypothetical protein CEXT_684021 [Caerostris extrusa]
MGLYVLKGTAPESYSTKVLLAATEAGPRFITSIESILLSEGERYKRCMMTQKVTVSAMTRSSIVHSTREGFSLQSIPKVRSVRTIILLGRVEGGNYRQPRAQTPLLGPGGRDVFGFFVTVSQAGPMEVFYDP